MSKTKIEWATDTVNVFVGCSKVSAACDNCYAERMARRLQAMGVAGYEGVVDENGWTGRVNFVPERLDNFRVGKAKGRGKRIFVGSMTDIFHPNIKESDRHAMFDAMVENPHNTYYLLTKRPDRIPNNYASFITANPVRTLGQPHIFLGVTVESTDYLWRIEDLCKKWKGRKFVSAEPLLGHLQLSGSPYVGGPTGSSVLGSFEITSRFIRNLDWLIVGGETGPGARPMHPDWVRSLRDQAVNVGVPFFFKSWGEWAPEVKPQDRQQYGLPYNFTQAGHPCGHSGLCMTGHEQCAKLHRYGKKASGRTLDGRKWNEIPEVKNETRS